MATRLKKGVVKYFKDNIGIIIALLAMFVFLMVFPTTRSTFLTSKNMFNISGHRHDHGYYSGRH